MIEKTQMMVKSPEEALFLAKALFASKLLPDWIKSPEAACFIIIAGAEFGMPPTRALRSLQVVKGKIIESADSQIARFKEHGGKATFSTLDDKAAELTLTHPNGDKHTERFSLEDAKRAGLLSNSNWSRYPRAMLRSRVITAGLKSLGWVDSAGVYDPDEAREIGGESPAIEADTPGVETPTERAEDQKRPRRKSETETPVEPTPECPQSSADDDAGVVVETTDEPRASVTGSVTGVFRSKGTSGFVVEIDGVRFGTDSVEIAQKAKAFRASSATVAVTLDGDKAVEIVEVA